MRRIANFWGEPGNQSRGQSGLRLKEDGAAVPPVSSPSSSSLCPQASSLLPTIMVAKVLQRPTLVLNRNWQPVNVATVARALVLLWNEAARVVDPEDYQLYTCADWSQMTPRAGDAFIQAV